MRRMAVPSQGDKVRGDVFPAQSVCKVLEQKEDRFLVQVDCHTGVTHQVRAHLAAVGFPLVGDSLYDPLHKERGAEYPHHLLRAVKLVHTDEESFALNFVF